MGLAAATAQDPVSGKSLGGTEMGVCDRDQALPFHRLGSLAVLKRPIDAPRYSTAGDRTNDQRGACVVVTRP
jgi:hypothetical protein